MTRQALLGDLDGENPQSIEVAVELLRQSVPTAVRGLVPYDAPRYRRFIAMALAPAPELRTVLMRTVLVDGQLVAVADWRVLERELFLNGLSVRKEFRGQGHGRRLILDGVAMAGEFGVESLGLDVACDNLPALDLYRSSGFVDASVATWVDVTDDPSGSVDSGIKVVDWPVFQSQRDAYGFGDLTLRDRAGEVARIRTVGNAMRMRWDGLKALPLSPLRLLLGASRAYAVGPPEAGSVRPPFARFIRMRRDVSDV
jgi:ribosomal protein S18 acetylase RimI-like enzyme